MTREVRPWFADQPGVKWAGDAEPIPSNGEPEGVLLERGARSPAPAAGAYVVVVDGVETTLQLSDADARRMGLLDGGSE